MYRTALKHEVSASEMQYLRDQGLTNKAIAERLDISPATVCRYLQPKTTRLTNDDKQAIVEMYKNGKSVKEIAESYEKSPFTIYHVLNDAGLKRERMKTEKVERNNEQKEPIQEEFKPEGRLIFNRVGVYSGRLGEYYVDKETNMVTLPCAFKCLNKDDLGYLIRDLQTVWLEV